MRTHFQYLGVMINWIGITEGVILQIVESELLVSPQILTFEFELALTDSVCLAPLEEAQMVHLKA